MKLILIAEVPKIGKSGDQVEVRDGFARNFLIPNNLAVISGSPEAKKILAGKSAKKEETNKIQKDDISKISALDGKKITFKIKVNKKGIPYQAISAKDIAKSLGINSEFVKSQPFKKMGIYDIQIQSGSSNSKVIVEIIPEK